MEREIVDIIEGTDRFSPIPQHPRSPAALQLEHFEISKRQLRDSSYIVTVKRTTDNKFRVKRVITSEQLEETIRAAIAELGGSRLPGNSLIKGNGVRQNHK